jgi:predicted TPR repeat methyltransferase
VDEAGEIYRRWLLIDPNHPVARHMAAATSGEAAPARAEDHFVSTLFDRAAASFDERLAALGYRAPRLAAELLVLHPGWSASTSPGACSSRRVNAASTLSSLQRS